MKRFFDPQFKFSVLNFSVLPILSVIGAVMKLLGLTSHDWLYVLVEFPIMMQLTLIVSCGIIVVLALVIKKLVKVLEKDQERQ